MLQLDYASLKEVTYIDLPIVEHLRDCIYDCLSFGTPPHILLETFNLDSTSMREMLTPLAAILLLVSRDCVSAKTSLSFAHNHCVLCADILLNDYDSLSAKHLCAYTMLDFAAFEHALRARCCPVLHH